MSTSCNIIGVHAMLCTTYLARQQTTCGQFLLLSMDSSAVSSNKLFHNFGLRHQTRNIQIIVH